MAGQQLTLIVKAISRRARILVVFARVLAAGANVLILDQPMAGVFIIDDLDEILRMCDRLVVMRHGQAAPAMPAEGIDRAGLLRVSSDTAAAAQVGRGQYRTIDEPVAGVVAEPVLAGPVTLSDGRAASTACWRACCEGEASQQPLWPQRAQRRRWNHHPPQANHSTKPGPHGGTVGSMSF